MSRKSFPKTKAEVKKQLKIPEWYFLLETICYPGFKVVKCFTNISLVLFKFPHTHMVHVVS